MQNEKKVKLLETMKKINKNFKEDFMGFAEEKEITNTIKSGIKGFDDLTAGFKKGTFTVVYGGTGVGKSTLVLQTIANAQQEGKVCCYIDMERSFEHDRAMDLGVNLNDLVLVSNCQTAEQALDIIRALSIDKVVDLIILDSIQAMSPQGEQQNKGKERSLAEKEMAELARTLSKFFRVVAPDIYKSQIACVLIGQIRMNLGSFIVKADLSGGEALKHWAYQLIFMRRGQRADAPCAKIKHYKLDEKQKLKYQTKNEEVGFDVVAKLCKTKSSKSKIENSDVHLAFVYNSGFVNNFIPEETFVIDGTDEEKAQIEKILIEKGIIKMEKPIEPEPPELRELTEHEMAPVKKKRGRKPKGNK